MQNVHVRRLGGSIGAEIHGIDVSQRLSPEAAAFIRQKVIDHHVVFFPGQPDLGPEQQLAFARNFGVLEDKFPSIASQREGFPEIVFFDGARGNGRAGMWHTDVTVSATPPMGCIIFIKEVPECGGDTMWADTTAAYEALSGTFQEFLNGLTAVHDMLSEEIRARPGGFDAREWEGVDLSRLSRAEHPVVRVLPETGRKCLFVNPLFTSHIKGLRRSESGLILNHLFTVMMRPEFICRRHWSKGDVAFWDNRCTMHAAVDDYGKGARLVERVSIRGDAPFGVARSA